MKNNNRLTIGFMIHRLDNDYAKSLLKGAVSAAKKADVNIVIFHGRSINSQLDDHKYTIYEYQNNVVYSYVSKESLDAVIISAGTVGSFITNEELKCFVDKFEGLPVITTENKIRGYPCIRMSSSGIKDVISHLVKHHSRKNIAFVSGPKNNADAQERLNFYKEALAENGLEYDENMVAYGKFSEYCVDIVGELIDKNNGKIDAICFANDMMCKGGYKAIEQRGLIVGKDIAVTGYDDSEVATGLKPMLTTVRADASRLGRYAVSEAIKLIKTGSCNDMSLGSSPVIRQSCGCSGLVSSMSCINSGTEINPIELARAIVAENLIDAASGYELETATERLATCIAEIFRFASSDNANSEFVQDSVNTISELMDWQIFNLIKSDILINIIKSVQKNAITLCNGNKDKIISVYEIIRYSFELIADRTLNMYYNTVDDLSFTHFLINNITKDMTIYGSDEEKGYFSIVNNLYRIHMDSSYIYTYENPIIHTATMEWQLPKHILLKSYHDGDRLTAVTGDTQYIPTSDFLCNKFTSDRRKTVVVSPLYINEEQYGILVSELEYKYFPYIYSITPQICTAIKLTNLVRQLENSLDDAHYRNNMLNRISMCDELTGIYNRRGFYEFANSILKSPENEGRHAALVFGDLDNLKKINDTFGHDDGDYAIVSAANYMKNGLRQTDVVARIGGDEFAALAVCDDINIIHSIPQRIKNLAALHNLNSDKPYNVNISIGLFEMICSPSCTIQSYMDKADAALYSDKKNKQMSILKKDN